jgi:hypothetical protein
MYYFYSDEIFLVNLAYKEQIFKKKTEKSNNLCLQLATYHHNDNYLVNH